jgi:hypothetical protein
MAKSAAFWTVAQEACAAGATDRGAGDDAPATGNERIDALRQLVDQGRDAGVALLRERAESSREALRKAPTLAERMYHDFVGDYPKG